MKRPTQNDVARLAGVSRATVSYVINGSTKGPIQISEETRDKILEAARQLGYEPDAAAQSLRSQKSQAIGVLVPDMLNPHYWKIVRGVENTLREQDYDLLLMSTSLNPERESTALRNLLRRRVDGLILMLSYYDQEQEEVQTILHRRSPVVMFGHRYAGLDTISPDEKAGSAELFQHLRELGHRRVGLIYGVAQPDLAAGRLEIYRRFITENAPELGDDLIEYCGPSIEDGRQAAERLMQRRPRPTAIVVINDLLAMGAMHAVFRAGLRVPEDISIAGYDDIDQAAYLNPGLTTVQMYGEELGRRAAEILFERILDPDRPPQHIDLPTHLILRGSTGPVTE